MSSLDEAMKKLTKEKHDACDHSEQYMFNITNVINCQDGRQCSECGKFFPKEEFKEK